MISVNLFFSKYNSANKCNKGESNNVIKYSNDNNNVIIN
jgi:hypothetical protein